MIGDKSHSKQQRGHSGPLSRTGGRHLTIRSSAGHYRGELSGECPAPPGSIAIVVPQGLVALGYTLVMRSIEPFIVPV